MNTTIVALVIGAAVLHASWNALLKSGGDRMRSMVVMTGTASVAAIPAVILLPPPPLSLWPLVVLACALHNGYNVLLVRAYAHGDLGQVYPIARGASPLLVTLIAALVVGERPDIVALLGVVLVSAGVVSLARGWAGATRAGILTAVATGGFIAAYTVVDGMAGRLSGRPIAFAAWLFLIDGIVLAAIYALSRGWGTPSHDTTRETLKSAAGGLISVLAYGVVIWAASISPMGPVSALRETSVVFAALLGWLFLGERLSVRRLGSCLLVAMGAVILGQHG